MEAGAWAEPFGWVRRGDGAGGSVGWGLGGAGWVCRGDSCLGGQGAGGGGSLQLSWLLSWLRSRPDTWRRAGP